MIDIRKLKELVRLMVANDLSELDLRDAEEQVTLRRHTHHVGPAMMASPHVALAGPPATAAAAAPETAPADKPAAEDPDLHKIESPMVGTFYTSPSPDAAPFVEAGAIINSETVICLVEAMKIFNEIKAECSGTIEKVLVKNGEPVEFGQPLFLVRT